MGKKKKSIKYNLIIIKIGNFIQLMLQIIITNNNN